MSVLFPSEVSYGPEWQGQEVLHHPAPAGGCLQLIRYDRFMSNWINEFDRPNRIIDRSKLTAGTTLNDIYDIDRFMWVAKVSVMGVSEKSLLPFERVVYPERGMACLSPVPPEFEASIEDQVADAGQ